MPITWQQSYDPTRHWQVSTFFAVLPLLILIGALIGLRLKAHVAALLALASVLLIATTVFAMPAPFAVRAALFGAAYGLFPIFWIVFPVIFLYQLTVSAGRFALLEACLIRVTDDSRLQLLLIAFIFGAFFEGVAGFGTPVAVCGTILIGLGFRRVEAAGLALLANTAPVAFGSIGIPVIALHGVTGLDTLLLTRVIAALLTPFCVLVPFWLIWVYVGFRRMLEIWPAILLAGITFGATQLLVGTLHGPWLVDISASILSLLVFLLFLRIWKPRRVLNGLAEDITDHPRSKTGNDRRTVLRAATPWIILTIFVTVWGTPAFSLWLSRHTTAQIPIPGLDHLIFRVPPIVAHATAEPAIFTLNWLSAAGSGIFLAALVAAFSMGLGPRDIFRTLRSTLVTTRFTLITIAALMALGYVTRFCGLDATLGLAFARTGALYPFFGTLVGWLGTASTGSDTSSNVLFGGLQKFTAEQLGLSPYLMASANSGGGVMGKMIAPQSVVVASTATGTYGSEGAILRFVLLHSVALACLMGLAVSLVAWSPFLTRLILH